MVALNANGEVADLLSVNQFAPNTSAFMCVPFAASLCNFCGKPGQGPGGTAVQASNLAMYWYGHLEGSTNASNTNGMSIEDEHKMLQGMNLSYHPAPPTLAYIKAWLRVGYPVMICGAETGMYDIELGDIVPYSWTPSGNHCIVASGVTADGNLLVHDTANIGPTGVRPGPRTYDASKLQIVSATAVAVPWLPALPTDYDPTHVNTSQNGDTPPLLQLTDPMGKYFVQVASTRWHCPQTNNDIAYAHLDFYRQYQGIFGLPRTGEIYLAQFPGTAIMVYERAIAAYDPENKIPHEKPPGSGNVYLLHIDSGTGQQIIAKPLLVELQGQVSNLQVQITALEAEKSNLPDVAALQTKLTSCEGIITTIINALLPVENQLERKAA